MFYLGPHSPEALPSWRYLRSDMAEARARSCWRSSGDTAIGALSIMHIERFGMIDLEKLAQPMAGDGCRAEPFAEQYRDALRDACAEDRDIWAMYANDFGPDAFDTSITTCVTNPRNRTFVLFDGNEIAGMSSFLGIDEARQVVEIGGTYYRPHLRGTGLNRRVKDMMLERAFGCGIRRVEFRVDARNARSQAAMTKLGAVREGVLRADRITWTGHVRDTVLFSILRDEWSPAHLAA